MKGPTVNFKTKTLECKDCKAKQKIVLPQALGPLSHQLSTFAHEHRDCADEKPAPPANP